MGSSQQRVISMWNSFTSTNWTGIYLSNQNQTPYVLPYKTMNQKLLVRVIFLVSKIAIALCCTSDPSDYNLEQVLIFHDHLSSTQTLRFTICYEGFLVCAWGGEACVGRVCCPPLHYLILYEGLSEWQHPLRFDDNNTDASLTAMSVWSKGKWWNSTDTVDCQVDHKSLAAW